MLTLFALLQTNSFRQYVLRIAYRQLAETFGAQVRMRDFTLRLSGFTPTVDMYDVVVDSPPPFSRAPLLKADHISVAVKIVSLLSRELRLNDIEVDHPIIHIFVDKDGDNNLPKPEDTGQHRTSVFDIGVSQVQLIQGEFVYNDRQTSIDADLRNLQFQSTFDPIDRRYSGTLIYSDGAVRLGEMYSVAHGLNSEFEATPKGFNLKRGVLTSGRSQVEITATLEDYTKPRIQARYQATADSADLSRILKNDSLPAGTVQLEGTGQYEHQQNQPFLAALTLSGNINSKLLRISTPKSRADVHYLDGRFELHNGDLDVQDLRGRIFDGSFAGSLTIQDVAGDARARLSAAFSDLGLAGIQSMMDSPHHRRLQLRGTASGAVEATWNGPLKNLEGRSDAAIKAAIAPNPRGNKQGDVHTAPVNGEIHVQYSASNQQISFSRSYLRMPKTVLSVTGAIRDRAGLQVQFRSSDLHEVENVANLFITPPSGQPEAIGLSGAASFLGAVRGSTSNPQIVGQFSASSLSFRGSAWRTAQTQVDLSASHLILRNGSMASVDGGRINLDANLGLRNWSFSETSPMQVSFTASQLNVANIINLAGLNAPITGTVTANVSLTGSRLNPVGRGTATLSRGTIFDEPIQSLNVTFRGAGNELETNSELRMDAGVATGTIKYIPSQETYTGRIAAKGIQIDKLQGLRARSLQVTGLLNFTADGAGTLNDPNLQLVADVPQLQIRSQNQVQTLNNLQLRARIADRLADVDLRSETMDTFLRGRGRVMLDGAYDAEAVLDTSPVSLQPLLALYAPAQAQNINGYTELHATLKGPLKDRKRISAHLSIPKLEITYRNTVELAAAQPIEMDYSGGVLTIQRTTLRGANTDLEIAGAVPLDSSTPMTLNLNGNLDLQLAQMWDPDITSSGQMHFDVVSRGSRTNPDVKGQIKIANASLATAGAPLGIENGNGVLTLLNDRIEIQQFNGNVGGGVLRATGRLIYWPTLQYNVTLSGSGIRMLYPQGVREALDANLTMVGSGEGGVLRGKVSLNELSFSSNFDLANFAGQSSRISRAGAPQSVSRNLLLDISVQSANDLNLVSSKLSLQGSAALRIRGTAAEPVVLGRVNLNEGDVIFRGNRYLLLPSTIDFVNPYELQPIMNLAAETTVQEYNIHLLFRGPLDHLKTNYSSDPALPPSDIINLLVFGKTTEADEANPTPGNLGAQSIIASSVSKSVTNRIERVAGISQLSIDPVLGGNQNDPGARITVQQRVTGNLFVTFATDVTATEREVIKLEYQVSPRVAVSGVRDQNGGFALDLRIKKTW